MEQKLKSEQSRQIIIDAAFHIFYKNGFKTTSIKDIMASTSLSKGAFYHHFRNKEEIGIAVISDRIYKRIYKSMIAPLYDQGNSIDTLISVFSERIKSLSQEEKKMGCPANNLINEIGNTQKAYQAALRRIIEEWKASLMALIEKGKRAGEIRKNVVPMSVAVYLIIAFEGIRGIRKLYDDDQIFNDYISALTEYINFLK